MVNDGIICHFSGGIMLNAFLIKKIEASVKDSTDDIDFMVAEQLRVFLQTGHQKPSLEKTNGMPLLHWLAERRLFRCMDAIVDNYHNVLQRDDKDRNFLEHLIFTRKYRIANNLVERYREIGQSERLIDLAARNHVAILLELTRAIQQNNSEAIQLVIQLLTVIPFKIARESKNIAEQKAHDYAMNSLNQAIISLENSCKPAVTILLEKLIEKGNLLFLIGPYVDGLPEKEVLSNRLLQEKNEISHLFHALYSTVDGVSESEDEHLQKKRTLLVQCKMQLATSIGSQRYAAFEKSSVSTATLRLMR